MRGGRGMKGRVKKVVEVKMMSGKREVEKAISKESSSF
jgi:hypothetical protein